MSGHCSLSWLLAYTIDYYQTDNSFSYSEKENKNKNYVYNERHKGHVSYNKVE